MSKSKNIQNILAAMSLMSYLSPDGGYGGIYMCTACKKNGRDKFKDEETGQIIDFCDYCPNNMTNAYRNEG